MSQVYFYSRLRAGIANDVDSVPTNVCIVACTVTADNQVVPIARVNTIVSISTYNMIVSGKGKNNIIFSRSQ